MLVLPRIGSPAACSRATTVASYGGTQPSRIREPQVVGQPLGGQHVLDRDRDAVQRGWPAPRPRGARPRPRPAPAPLRRRRAGRRGPPRRPRRSVQVRLRSARPSVGLTGGRAAAAMPRRAGRAGSAHCSSPRIRGTLNRCCSASGAPDSACSAVRPGTTTSVAEHVGQRQRVGGGRDVVAGHRADRGDRLQDHAELRRQVVELVVGQVDPGEVGQVGDLVAGDLRHSARRRRGTAGVRASS